MSLFGFVVVNLQLMAEQFEESAFTIMEGRVTKENRNIKISTKAILLPNYPYISWPIIIIKAYSSNNLD